MGTLDTICVDPYTTPMLHVITHDLFTGGGKVSTRQRENRPSPASTSTELCVPVAPGSPAGLVATMIVALVSTACLAVLVVEEDEPNGQGSHEEGEKSNEALLACLGCLVDLGHALGRGNL